VHEVDQSADERTRSNNGTTLRTMALVIWSIANQPDRERQYSPVSRAPALRRGAAIGVSASVVMAAGNLSASRRRRLAFAGRARGFLRIRGRQDGCRQLP
jgi:hypothetical protein